VYRETAAVALATANRERALEAYRTASDYARHSGRGTEPDAQLAAPELAPVRTDTLRTLMMEPGLQLCERLADEPVDHVRAQGTLRAARRALACAHQRRPEGHDRGPGRPANDRVMRTNGPSAVGGEPRLITAADEGVRSGLKASRWEGHARDRTRPRVQLRLPRHAGGRPSPAGRACSGEALLREQEVKVC
jgi:hypothetical protein